MGVSPVSARFTTVDPIRDGASWFSYVVNDPVNYVDPFGLTASDSRTVRSGDTLSGMTAQFNKENGTNYTWQQIGEYNNLANPNLIIPGQTINFPGRSTATTTTATTATQAGATPSTNATQSGNIQAQIGNNSNASTYSAPFNYGTGKYGSLPTFSGINSGNTAIDIIVNNGIVGTYNLVAGLLNTLDNSIGAWKELIAYGIEREIDFLDENIPCEFTNTGNGFRQDLYALEQLGFVNPSLISDGLACLSESVKYAKVMGGASAARNKAVESISSMISNGEVKGNNIISNLDDKTRIIFRKEFGENSHPISPKYPQATNHYNIEIQKYSEKGHQFKTWRDYHIIVDDNNKIIDYFEQ